MNRRCVYSVITLAALLSACASEADVASPSTTSPSSSTTPTSTTRESKGWIGGEPEWHGADGEMTMDAAAGAAPEVLAASEAASTATEPPSQPPDNSPLRAGSVDDNADFAAYLEYLARIKDLGIATRPFDPTGRVVVTVTGTSGLPVAGAEISVTSEGSPVATIRTNADGTARFLPALFDAGQASSFDFTAFGVTASSAPGIGVALTVDQPGGAQSPVAIDVLFLLDATGSMGDEIDRLKTTIDSVAGRIAEFDPKPDVRFGMTLYRDLGDTFLTSTYDFTSDVTAFRGALADVVADGGGDYPEALDEALADAMSAPTWRDPSTTIQLIFLVADAPPHVDRQVATPYTASIIDATSRGIKVIPIASSESDDQAEAVFRQLAEATGGRFVFLSYGAGGAATGANTDIESTDYEELSLDDLIVRLVAEELSALAGADVGVPTQTTTPPTNPDGQ
jgi:von Willebrand factor type A domain